VKAILLVGGLGTRLRPMTLTCPKPLLPIGNLPLIERIVLNLRAHGIKEFVFLLHYKPEMFIAALGDGRRGDARFQYVTMDEDLSTAGSVKFVREHVTETTLVHSGDILADLPLRRMFAFHRRRRALVTLALHPVAAPLPFGLVLRESDGRIRRFFEKPTWPQVFSDWINASIYLIEPELLAHIPGAPRAVLFEQEVFPPLAAANAAIYGFPIEGYWRDVGTPEDLRLANMDYLNGRLPQKMLTPDERTWLIPAGEKSVSHFVIGHDSKLAPDAHIETSVIGANCVIASHAKIHGAVIFDNVAVERGALINNAILMRGVSVEAKAEIHPHAVLAENAQIGAAAIICANAVARTGAQVAPGETLHAKRVLPTGYLRRFVDGGSLLGSLKSGMSVELMRWVGKTFALRQAQKENKNEKMMTLLLATQDEDHFNAWARALAQGMLSAGGEVHLLESVTLPLARWALQKGGHRGGIYLGADRHAELLRLAFMHPTAEDFSTEETCSLERIDLIDAPNKGNLRLLEAALWREDYLRMVINCACTGRDETAPRRQSLPQSILNKPIPVRVGVVGQASEQIVENFFALVDGAAKVEVFPLDMSASFRRHTRAAQKAFVQSLSADAGLGVWIGGVGERIQLALPGYGMLPRGRSDALIARLLIEQNPGVQIVAGWLFPNFAQKLPSQIRRYEGCMLTAASLRAANSQTRLIGFDGRGGIAFSPLAPGNLPRSQTFPEHCGIAYPDALLALAFLLRALLKISRDEFAAMIPGTMLGYRLMHCSDDAKAYLMRRLVESHGQLACSFSDGIRLEDRNSAEKNWLVVRPCAGMPALEIYWEENTSDAVTNSKLNTIVRRQLAQWRALYAD